MSLRLNLKAKPQPNPAPLPTLLGIYKVKEDTKLEFNRYGHTWSFPEGFEVEVTHERAAQVLVNFQPGLTLYVDTQLFLECCTR